MIKHNLILLIKLVMEEIVNKFKNYGLFFGVNDFENHMIVNTNIKLFLYGSGKVITNRVSFNINKKTFNLKKSAIDYVFNKKTQKFDYVVKYKNHFENNHVCMDDVLNSIDFFIKTHEEKIENYI